jgi:hypothetical protein
MTALEEDGEEEDVHVKEGERLRKYKSLGASSGMERAIPHTRETTRSPM